MITLFIIFLGLAFGSFANVLIHRIPLHENYWSDRSRCPQCGASIAFYDNIPLLSYAILKGHCRHCGAGISVRYPLVELAGALMFLLAWFRFGLDVYTPVAMASIFILFVLSMIDLDTMYVPDGLILAGILVAVIPFVTGSRPFLSHSLAGFSYSLALYLIAVTAKVLMKKDAMGGGDIKLAFLIGLLLGPEYTLLSGFLSFIIAAFVLLALKAASRVRFGQEVPFVPFMASAAILSLLYGDLILKFYWKLVQ